MFLKNYIPDEDCLRLINEYVGLDDAKKNYDKVLKQMSRKAMFMTTKHSFQRYYTEAVLTYKDGKEKSFYFEIYENYKINEDQPIRILADGFVMLCQEYDKETWDKLTIYHTADGIKCVFAFHLDEKMPRKVIREYNKKYKMYFGLKFENFKVCPKCQFSFELKGFGLGYNNNLNSTKKLYKFCIFCRKPPSMERRPLPLHLL